MAFNRWFFWDGRADSLWAQALQPIENEKEMGGDRLHVMWMVYGNPELRTGYEAVFGTMPDLNSTDFPDHAAPKNGDHPHNKAWLAMDQESQQIANRVFANLGKAIAAYERLLISKNAPFDQFLEGLETNNPEKMAALSHSQQRGFKLFIGKARCRLCHSGPNFTDLEFHNTGVPPLRDGLPVDSGRYAGVERVHADPFNTAGKYSHDSQGDRARSLSFLRKWPEQWGQFKTPGLRNIAQTPPYMHQGQLPNLEAVVAFYNNREGSIPTGHAQDPLLLPLNLTEQEAQDLAAFLKSLSGEPLKPWLLRKPQSAVPPQ